MAHWFAAANVAYAQADEQLLNSGQWKLMGFKDFPEAQFDYSNGVLRVRSDNSVGFYYREVLSGRQMRESDWELSWEWRVLDTSEATETKTADVDDRPVAVHVWINNPGSVGWFRGSLARLFSVPVPGNMITYSWGGTEQIGEEFPNPHIPEEGYIKVLRNHSESGETWFSERVRFRLDLLSEYPDIDWRRVYVVISSDNEDSEGFATAEVRNLRLMPISDDEDR